MMVNFESHGFAVLVSAYYPEGKVLLWIISSALSATICFRMFAWSLTNTRVPGRRAPIAPLETISGVTSCQHYVLSKTID